jgi:hypothetical protein
LTTTRSEESFRSSLRGKGAEEEGAAWKAGKAGPGRKEKED